MIPLTLVQAFHTTQEYTATKKHNQICSISVGQENASVKLQQDGRQVQCLSNLQPSKRYIYK